MDPKGKKQQYSTTLTGSDGGGEEREPFFYRPPFRGPPRPSEMNEPEL